MKFNPYTQRLFANNGQLLKQLHCPLQKEWHAMGTGEEKGARTMKLIDGIGLASMYQDK